MEKTQLLQERAVVLGSGVGGLAAAAALRNHFEDVVVIERDKVPEPPETRRGVPQDEQLHNLLSCAQVNLEKLMPGFLDSLREAGAGDASVANETHVYELGIRMPERNLGLRLMSAWRPVIEHVARRQLLQDGQVTFQDSSRASGLEVSRSRGLRGVIVDTEDGEKSIEASIIIDATGTGSTARRWLEYHGRQVPPVDTIKVDQWYASTIFKRPETYLENDDFWLSFPDVGETRGGLASPVGNDLWYVSLSGRTSDQPPKTPEDIKAYAETLGDQGSISHLLNGAEAQSLPNLFRKTTASIRRYDLVAHPLPGILPLGDSVASLNPLFGQGMSVASQQAVELDALLREYRAGSIDRQDLTVRYLGKAVMTAKAAWGLGEIVDQTISGTDDTDIECRRLRQNALAKLIKEDPELHRLYVGIWHLIEPATALQESELLNRIDEMAKVI
jgi:2-polyprenyl-6-methoxyphenol hydroxylase-like FAD-dependent oxidoreductase